MIAVLYLLACGHEASTAPVDATFAHRMEWAPVGAPSSVPIVTLAAEALPAPASEVQLAPPAAGRLLRWHVSPGDDVDAGTPLADLASPQLSALRSRVSALSGRVQQARTQQALVEASAAGGVASRLDVQAAQGLVREAEAALAGTRRELAAYGGSSGSGLTWTAPYSGIVGELRCPVGPVGEGVPCLTLQRDQKVLLQVRVPARHLTALEGPLQATFASLDGTTSSFTETSRAPGLDRHTRSLLVQFSSEDHVMPGAAGRALLSAPRAGGLHLIPRSALTRVDGVPAVFVGSSEAPESRVVQVVGGDGESVLVRGLEVDDQVATKGVFLLKSLLAQEAP